MEQPKSKIGAPLTIAGIIVVIAGIIGYTNIGKNSSNTATTTPDQTGTSVPTTGTDGSFTVVNSTTTTTTTVPPASKYKDGTYSADGNYISPGGAQAIGVTVTLQNDIIVSSSAQEKASDPESRQYEDRFISGYQQYVIGKNIDQVSVGRVSGSSLTPAGFNAALAKIKVQAQA